MMELAGAGPQQVVDGAGAGVVPDLLDARRLGGFAFAFFRRAARAHFAPGEIENPGAMPARGHLQQRAAAGLLRVVAVGGNGQDFNHRGHGVCHALIHVAGTQS